MKTLYWGLVAARKAEGEQIDANTGKVVKQSLAEKIKAGWSMASSAGAIPYIG